jgi:hypothetical protein
MVTDNPNDWRLHRRWRGASLEDLLMTTPHQRKGTACGHRLRSPKGAQVPTHQGGQPTGEAATLVNVPIPRSLLAQLDRYIERLASQTGSEVTRGLIARRALEILLERDEGGGLQSIDAPPLCERDAFHGAYLAIGHGRDFVRIHRLRAYLGWPRARFDTVLQQLAAAYVIELHGGDPSSMTATEIADSYQEPGGMMYLCTSWRGARMGDGEAWRRSRCCSSPEGIAVTLPGDWW